MEKYKAYFDVSTTTTPEFVEFCPMNISDSQNVSMDTWFNLCSEFANNEVTGIDPQWDFTAKFETTDVVGQFIAAKKYKVGTERTCKVKLINLEEGTAGKQITFTATFDDITKTYETETVTEISFTIKLYRGTTFAEADYVAPSV